MLNTETTCHACPNKGLASSFKKLDGCSAVMDNELSMRHGRDMYDPYQDV